ncbi:centrobin-like isoform X2 [Xenia sp. Carnegie-2017]|uniref:centrobin-like isoform X2 n=1 Tax=Xenia sp. Carnegie-2017 TaxID=2897299 RepID=UPI001F03FF49|nr:centrobin-like isoform X2 [Xenia sp. Carnegie-2017]
MEPTGPSNDERRKLSSDVAEKTEPNINDTLTSVDIQEIEKVRQSLQSMLQTSENYLQDDEVASKSLHTTGDILCYSSNIDEQMFPSLANAKLVNSLVSNDSKEVKMTHEVVRLGSGNTSDKTHDKSLLLENSLLKETLEKERSKRKHCEQQIKGIQAKLLESQQELAAAFSAARKKDLMINQLDKTLARVVEDWKKHEEEKFEAMHKLEEQHENDANFQLRQQEVLAQFEKDLNDAAVALSREQQRATDVERDKDNQISAFMKERNEFAQALEREKTKNENFGKEFENLEQSIRSAKESQSLFEQEKLTWQEEKSQLESKIELITKTHAQDMENERKLVDREKQVAEDSQRVLSAVQKEVQQLTQQLDTCFREKENLKTEITLMTAKFEAQRTRQESEHRAELERQMSKNLREAQSQLSKTENEIKNAHKKQIEDLTKKYRRDLEEQLNNFHQQLKERDRKIKETTDGYEERLEKSHKDLVSVSKEHEALRKEKYDMIKQLQKMMQSHCAEAMSLLTSTTKHTLRIPRKDGYHDDLPTKAPSVIASTSNVAPLNDTNRVFSSYVTPRNYTMRSSMLNSHDQTVLQQQQYSHVNDETTRNLMSNEIIQNWVRLPVLHAGPNTSDIQDEDVIEHDRQPYVETIQPNHKNEQEFHIQKQVQDPDIEEEEINESFVEHSLDESKTSLSKNLSMDVLNMLQQQQSRQSELNHYVRQLLKKSPSSASDGINDGAEFKVDDGQNDSDYVSSDGKKVDVSNMEKDLITIKSGHSDIDYSDVKQMAFSKSAATPGKRFNKTQVNQTPPSKEKRSVSTAKSSFTPEQLFQYLRDVQIRHELGESKALTAERKSKTPNSNHDHKESKTKKNASIKTTRKISGSISR